MIERDKMLFWARVMEIAREKFAASAEGSDAEPFLDALFGEYLAAAPSETNAWIRSRLAVEYRWVDEPPEWIEAEPSWPFHHGKPMVFITQYEIPDSEVARHDLTTGTVLYIFGSREPDESGFRVVYEIVRQYKDADGVGKDDE